MRPNPKSSLFFSSPIHTLPYRVLFCFFFHACSFHLFSDDRKPKNAAIIRNIATLEALTVRRPGEGYGKSGGKQERVVPTRRKRAIAKRLTISPTCGVLIEKTKRLPDILNESFILRNKGAQSSRHTMNRRDGRLSWPTRSLWSKLRSGEVKTLDFKSTMRL